MKKKLNENAIINELRGESSYFPKEKAVEAPVLLKASIPQKPEKKPAKSMVHETTTPRYHDTTQPSPQDEMIEMVRRAVKRLGKEAATYRFTQEEKRALADIVYVYKGRGIKTSENEVTRISLNYLLEDYRQNGKDSLLAQIIERLNA